MSWAFKRGSKVGTGLGTTTAANKCWGQERSSVFPVQQQLTNVPGVDLKVHRLFSGLIGEAGELLGLEEGQRDALMTLYAFFGNGLQSRHSFSAESFADEEIVA